jgi:DNA modification methylase
MPSSSLTQKIFTLASLERGHEMQLGPYLLGPNSTAENGIYIGDTEILARALPGKSTDIVFTSPPYNTGMAYETYNDDLDMQDYQRFQQAWLEEAFRVTISGGKMYAIVGDNILWNFRSLAEKAGWIFHQILVWCKPNLVGSGRITRDWNMLTEWGLLFHKDKRTAMQAGALGINTHNWIISASAQSNFHGHKRKVHPAQMPLAVAHAWLSRTPGQIVYDPFMGSGTTAMAAKILGKRYIGFEIGPATAQLARDRVANTQPPLFTLQPEQRGFDL